MYDIATYTRANVEKTANSQVRLDARSDYSVIVWTSIQADLALGGNVSQSRPLATHIWYQNVQLTFRHQFQQTFTEQDSKWKPKATKSIHSSSHKKRDSPWYFLECTLHKSNGKTGTGVHRSFPCFWHPRLNRLMHFNCLNFRISKLKWKFRRNIFGVASCFIVFGNWIWCVNGLFCGRLHF